MKKKPLIIRLLVLIALLSSVFYGIYYASINKPLIKLNNCDFSVSTCFLTLKDKTIGVSFVQTPVTEEELLIEFSIPEGVKLEKAWIEGVNMYMGKTPVMFEDPNQTDTGITFLGSCNLNEMHWILFIEVIEANNMGKKNASNTLLSASFSTHMN